MWNNALVLDSVMSRIERGGFQESLIINRGWHFLPIFDENGKSLCQGSPSRFRYIEGCPPDNRINATPYSQKSERLVRLAYAMMRNENPPS